MEYQYSQCNCESCQKERLKLTKKEENNDFKKLLKTFETAFKTLFERKGYKPEDLLKVPEFKKVVEETAQVFSSAIPHETPSEMKAYLEKDAFIFSGLKTHAQLTEARSYLKDDNGHIVPFSKFQEKVLKLNERYNQHYLEAEYQFAVHSAQSAANWANLQEDTSRYWLEYRTAGDEKVRAQHQALNGICLPKDDDFWTEYYPPNGWRCRCIAVEVLAREKNLSDSKKAQELGEKATTHIAPNGKNKLQMFRFNPGKEQKIFPPNNAYSKVVGAEDVKKKLEKEIDNHSTIFDKAIDELKEKNVEYIKVQSLKNKLMEDEIISRVGGGDLTQGSCASLCFAYAGNKAGFDVLDFRDGESRAYFARKIDDVVEMAGGFVEKDYNDFKAINRLLKNIETDKEYILSTGRHASIIRKSKEKGWEYLELQSPTSNGYKPLTNERLKNRFDCKTKRTSYGKKIELVSSLIDIEKLKTDAFKDLLGYINTKESMQKKGIEGRTR